MATSLAAQQAQHRITTHDYKREYETYSATQPLPAGWELLVLQQDRSMFAVVYESPDFKVAYQAYAGDSRKEVVIVNAKHGCVMGADAERAAREVFDGLLPPNPVTAPDRPEVTSEWQFPFQVTRQGGTPVEGNNHVQYDQLDPAEEEWEEASV